MKEIRFILERYRAGGANRYTCPQCGRRKCFTRYVDVDSGEYVDEECGKCDHESSCGYHYTPREFFHDHPERQTSTGPLHGCINGSPTVLSPARRRASYVPPVVVQTEFFDFAWVRESARRVSTFRSWFLGLPFEPERIQQVLAEYYVGGTARDTIVGGVNYGPAVVFWQIDEQGRVHDAKLIAYTSDGHRVQNWGNSIRSICEKSGQGPQLAETEKVLFGLHLLASYPDQDVCIVESEKTALVCACRYPGYVWLATGGCGNLQARKIRPLMNRRVIVYPDSGEYRRWEQRMKESGHGHYHVVDFLEQYEPNTDIADILLGVARKKDLCPF